METSNRSRWMRVGIGVALLAVIGFQYYRTRPHDTGPTPLQIPPEGLLMEPVRPERGTDREESVARAHRLYALMEVFRRRHAGRFPASDTGREGDLVYDITRGMSEYGVKGFDGFKRTVDGIANPDAAPVSKPGSPKGPAVIAWLMPSKRPDGTPVGGPKEPGTRDVAAYDSTYYRQNIRVFRGDRTESKPTGFYTVLWEDGKVDLVPYDAVLYYHGADGSYHVAFRGQAGVPAGAMSYSEYQRTVVGRPPRSAGGRG